MKYTIHFPEFLLLAILLIFSSSAFSDYDDPNLTRIKQKRQGPQCYFSLKNYRGSVYPLINLSSKESDFTINSERLITKGRVIVFKDRIDSLKKDHPDAGTAETFPLQEYEFVSLRPSDGDVGLSCSDILNGQIIIKNKNDKLIFTPLKDIELKQQSNFYFQYLFYNTNEQNELDSRLIHISGVHELIKKLNDCAAVKDEGCFTRNFVPLKYGGEEIRNKKFHEIIMRGHIFSFPNARAYYEKTRNSEIEEDDHLPNGIEKMIDKDKSQVWSWLQDLFKLKLDDRRYINISLDKIEGPYNKVEIQMLRSSTRVVFVREGSKWFLEDLSLMNASDSLL